MELVQNLTTALSLAAVVLGVAVALRRREPPVPISRLVAVAAPAYLVLLLASELLVAALVPHLGLVQEPAMVALAALPAAIVAMAAWAALRWPAARRVALAGPFAGVAFLLLAIGFVGGGEPAVALVLLGLAVAGAAYLVRESAPHRRGFPGSFPLLAGVLVLVAAPSGFLYAALGLQEPQQARHAWSVEVRPEGDGPYELRVPFLSEAGSSDQPEQRSARHATVLGFMVRAMQPEGLTAEVADGGRSVVLRGEGPGAVRTEVAYHGDVGWREVHFEAAAREVTMASGPGATQVAWHLSLSGGQGHSCWTTAAMTATVMPGGNATLGGTDPDGDGRGGFQSVCA